MKVLIVEDVKSRQELIQEKVGIQSLDTAVCGEEALRLLTQNSYDLVFLDHDLVSTKSGSFLTQTWYRKVVIERQPFATKKPIVIIHSMNRIGAEKMENDLKGLSKVTLRIPFKLIFTNKIDLNEEIQRVSND